MQANRAFLFVQINFGYADSGASGSRKEHAMTDWNQIVENIQNAMQAVEQAHAAGENLRKHVSPDTFDEFKAHMQDCASTWAH
jgi:predicted lipid-binding transport protein (Tim44 family)